MTAAESLMLAFSFGTALGTMIANLVISIMTVVDHVREKRADKKARVEDTVM